VEEVTGVLVHRNLVRDLILSIITANGGTAVTRTMKPGEYRAALQPSWRRNQRSCAQR
jgi:predicted house-cleaning noncanonical NTP pyrophosphatase (MazG superfamily)